MRYSVLGHHPQCYSGTNKCLCNSSVPLGLPSERFVSSAILPEPPTSYRLSPRQVHMIYSSQRKPWTREELEETFNTRPPFATQQQSCHQAASTTQSTSFPNIQAYPTYHLTPDQIRLVYASQFNPALREEARKSMLSHQRISGNPSSTASMPSQLASQPRVNQVAIQQQQQQPYSQYRYGSAGQYPKVGVNSNGHLPTVQRASPSPSASSHSSGYYSGYTSSHSSSSYYQSVAKGSRQVTWSGYTSNVQATGGAYDDDDDDDEDDDDSDSESNDSDNYGQVY